MPGERSVGRPTPSFWYTGAVIKTSTDGAFCLPSREPFTRAWLNGGFASARGRAAPGVMREDGGFGAECGDPLVPQQGVP